MTDWKKYQKVSDMDKMSLLENQREGLAKKIKRLSATYGGGKDLMEAKKEYDKVNKKLHAQGIK